MSHDLPWRIIYGINELDLITLVVLLHLDTAIAASPDDQKRQRTALGRKAIDVPITTERQTALAAMLEAKHASLEDAKIEKVGCYLNYVLWLSAKVFNCIPGFNSQILEMLRVDEIILHDEVG